LSPVILRPRVPTTAWRDEELVEACLDGNELAWAAVVDKYKNLVYSAPIKYRMSPQDAADVFQEVWLDLYTELANLRKPGALGGWLISVASHKCFQWKRKRMRVAEQPAGEFDREPTDNEMLFPEWKVQDPQIPQSIWYFTDAKHVGFRVVRPLRVPDQAERDRLNLEPLPNDLIKE